MWHSLEWNNILYFFGAQTDKHILTACKFELIYGALCTFANWLYQLLDTLFHGVCVHRPNLNQLYNIICLRKSNIQYYLSEFSSQWISSGDSSLLLQFQLILTGPLLCIHQALQVCFILKDKFYHSMSKNTQYCQRSLPFEQLCILQGCLMQYPQPLQAVFCTTLLGAGASLWGPDIIYACVKISISNERTLTLILSEFFWSSLARYVYSLTPLSVFLKFFSASAFLLLSSSTCPTSSRIRSSSLEACFLPCLAEAFSASSNFACKCKV